jgi:hypothetical protein
MTEVIMITNFSPALYSMLKQHIIKLACFRKEMTRLSLITCSVICTGILFLSSGCEESTGYIPDYQQVVIQAYLYAGDTIDDIRVTKTIPIGAESGDLPPICDASVTLIKNKFSYTLTPSETDSGYYQYNGHDLVVAEGDIFTLNVDYFGKTSSGTTTVPPLPSNVALSNDFIMIPSMFDPRTFVFDTTKHQIRVSWDVEEDAMYFISINNIEEDPDSVALQIPPRGIPGRMIAMPLNQSSYVILFEDIRYYGMHSVTVYRINKEYVDLYISRNQNSRELNEPITNIENGLGVFSAFSSVVFYFDAIKD